VAPPPVEHVAVAAPPPPPMPNVQRPTGVSNSIEAAGARKQLTKEAKLMAQEIIDKAMAEKTKDKNWQKRELEKSLETLEKV
jgi:hypothetical protein